MQHATLHKKLQTLLIIHAALMMGVVLFALIVLVQGLPATATAPSALVVLRITSVGILASAVLLATVLRRAAINRLASRASAPSEDEMMTAFAALTFMRAAIAESVALLAIVLFMLSADIADLVIAAGAFVVLSAMIPLPSKWQSFVEAVQAARTLNAQRPNGEHGRG